MKALTEVEELIKTFNLPNFITLHSYYITKKTNRQDYLNIP